MLNYPFTEEDSQRAYEEWGANCGPNALAFALQCPIDEVRDLIHGFEERRYTSPSMMWQALDKWGAEISAVAKPDRDSMFHGMIALVRIQWTGPWTQSGANPRWAYRHTHWIATWREGDSLWVFDCNGGIQGFDLWQQSIVPLITATIPRADGGWFPTHIWRLIEK